MQLFLPGCRIFCCSKTSRSLLVHFFPWCNTNLYIISLLIFLFSGCLNKIIRQFQFLAKLVKCYPIGYFYLHFALISGHGGARAAEYVKHNLFSNLIRHPKFISDTKLAIADAYNHTDSEFLKSENNQHKDAGSTASTAILVGDRLLVANVGDSRAVICRGGTAIAVSRDHKPDQTDERQRIEDAGGFVMWAGTWRVGGVLAVSRAFGDRLLKQYVVADPEIQEEKVDGSLEFLILASDGLWDVVTNEEAVAMVKPIQDPEDAAKRLMQEAYQRGSADNITIVVVRFLGNQEGSSRAVSA